MDSSTLDALDRFLRSPPMIILVIVAAVLVTHVLRLIFRHVDKWSGHEGDVLVLIIELVITLVVAALTLKVYVFDNLSPASHAAWYEAPIFVLISLLLFALASMLMYWHFKRVK